MKKRMIALLSVSTLVAAMAFAAPAQLSGARICLLNLYDWEQNGSVSQADPFLSGGWTTTIVNEGVSGYVTLRGGLSLYPVNQPMRVDLAAGTVTLEVNGDPIGTSTGSRTWTEGPVTVTVDSTRYYYFVNEDWLLHRGDYADVQGVIEDDGSIVIAQGYGYYIHTVVTTTTRKGSTVTTLTDSMRTFSPIMRDTRLQMPNGQHQFVDEKDGTAHAVNVYMYQSNDTVWVTNLYGFGWRNNYMLLDADRVMTFPGQTIRDISNANNPGGDGVWYNTTLDAEENPVMGNTGSVSKDEITWGLMVPSDGDGLWWGYDENVLYFTDGTKFVIPSGPEPTLRGDVNEDGGVNIADVTDLIDMLLNGTAAGVANADCNGDGEVNIADVAALIDYLLTGIWPQ